MKQSQDENVRQLAILLKEFYFLISHSAHQETLSILYNSQLTMPQVITLHYIYFCQEASVSSISSRINLSLGATSHLVDRLVKMGYLVRSENAEDRRIKNISITNKGKEFIEKLNESRIAEFIKNLSQLDNQSIMRLVEVFTELTQRLRNLKGENICRKE